MLQKIIASLLICVCLQADQNLSRNDILYTNLAGAVAIASWGLVNWDYGKTAPHAAREGWFDADTKHGGADKLGHFYASYLAGAALMELYESYGYPSNDAAFYGAFSSFFLMGLMEAGDAFSPTQGFSSEDFWMNTAGSLASYVFAMSPELARKVDLRLEYVPSFSRADVLTEYERMKYLIALKAEGFDSIANPILKYTELHLGYYTRHYDGGISSERERILYVGIGINFSRFARQNGYSKTGRFLNYYQLPYTYMPLEHDYNH